MVVGSNPAVPTKFFSSLFACIGESLLLKHRGFQTLGYNALFLLDRAAAFFESGITHHYSNHRNAYAQTSP